MIDFRSQLGRTINFFSPAEGINATPVPGVHCVKFSLPDRRTKRRWRACLAVVAQGSKEVVLGRQVYRIDDGLYSATPIHLPFISRTSVACPGNPSLCLLIDWDQIVLIESLP